MRWNRLLTYFIYTCVCVCVFTRLLLIPYTYYTSPNERNKIQYPTLLMPVCAYILYRIENVVESQLKYSWLSCYTILLYIKFSSNQ